MAVRSPPYQAPRCLACAALAGRGWRWRRSRSAGRHGRRDWGRFTTWHRRWGRNGLPGRRLRSRRGTGNARRRWRWRWCGRGTAGSSLARRRGRRRLARVHVGTERLAVPGAVLRRARERNANCGARDCHGRGQANQPQARAGKAHDDLQSGVPALAGTVSTARSGDRLHERAKNPERTRQAHRTKTRANANETSVPRLRQSVPVRVV